MSDVITIIFNGEQSNVKQGCSIADYLQQVDVVTGRFIVAINDEFVPKSHYDSTVLKENDAFDVLSAISGG
ncbi:MAG: sulfur carrier protein ThiS [Gammaproteobacteria bacterium]|nr:sulfur carrier protein ThiS [Gammaproteobacteria bacterium]